VPLALPDALAARFEPLDTRTYGDTALHFLRFFSALNG